LTPLWQVLISVYSHTGHTWMSQGQCTGSAAGKALDSQLSTLDSLLATSHSWALIYE